MKKEIVINNQIEELERLAIFVEEVADELGLDPETTMNLNLALEEVVSNVILYAYPREMGEKITIMAQKENNNLVFTITDKGKEFDPTKVEEADITLSAEDRRTGHLHRQEHHERGHLSAPRRKKHLNT